MATVNATSRAMTSRNTTPYTRSTTLWPMPLRERAFISTELARQPDRGGGAPDGEAEEEVDQVDGHDRGADGLADGHAHTGRTATGCVAVVAVDQDDDHCEHHHL